MGYALVGSAGTVDVGTNSTSPSWGSGASRTAGNLLIYVVSSMGAGGNPTAPTGWVTGKQANSTFCSANIFFKHAAGSDAAPTTLQSGATAMYGQLFEFSGNDNPPLDQTASATGTGASTVITNASADVAAGDLVIGCGIARYSGAATETLSAAYNNGATATSFTNNGTSVSSHYCNSYGVTTGNSVGDSNTFSHTSTNLLATVGVLASFKALASTAFSLALSPGSLSITGSPVRMDFSELKLAPASFAITGSDANLVVPGSFPVNLSPGSFAITGINAIHKTTRQVAASPASFTITGTSLVFGQEGWLVPLNPKGESLTPITQKSLSLSPLSPNSKSLTPISPGSKSLSPRSPGSINLTPIDPSEH